MIRGDLQKIGAIVLSVLPAVTAIVTPGIGLHSGSASATPPSVEETAKQRLVSAFGNTFAVAESAHFALATDVEPEAVSELLACLEMTYERVEHFCRRYELPVTTLSRRLEVVCFKDRADFDRIAAPLVPNVTRISGLYDRHARRSYFHYTAGGDGIAEFRSAIGKRLKRPSPADDSPEDRATGAVGRATPDETGSGVHSTPYALRAEVDKLERRLVRITVQHEAAHQVLDHLCPALAARMPDWLSEGLACSFEALPEAGPDAYLAYNHWRAADARRCWMVEQTVEPGDRSVDGRPHEVDHLAGLRAIRDALTGGGDQHDHNVNSVERYAVAWAIVFYLQNEKPRAFRRYLQDVTSSRSGDTASDRARVWDEHFGAIDQTLARSVYATIDR
ncbi:MAG: DUF1570 domain-containing protein [Planctomycetes bacterium]|nr:DUF1570 domain-containing protein [Planctomycetota bacterium]